MRAIFRPAGFDSAGRARNSRPDGTGDATIYIDDIAAVDPGAGTIEEFRPGGA